MSRLKKGLSSSKMQSHARRNGYRDIKQLRRAEEREAISKIKLNEEKEERERMVCSKFDKIKNVVNCIIYTSCNYRYCDFFELILLLMSLIES